MWGEIYHDADEQFRIYFCLLKGYTFGTMESKGRKFVTAVNCIDGRAQEPLLDFMKNRFAADYVDMITEPGPDKILSEKKHGKAAASIRDCVLISFEKHGSQIIAIAGHYDCAANPVEEAEHLRQIAESVRTIQEWNLPAEVFGIWINKDGKASIL